LIFLFNFFVYHTTPNNPNAHFSMVLLTGKLLFVLLSIVLLLHFLDVGILHLFYFQINFLLISKCSFISGILLVIFLLSFSKLSKVSQFLISFLRKFTFDVVLMSYFLKIRAWLRLTLFLSGLLYTIVSVWHITSWSWS